MDIYEQIKTAYDYYNRELFYGELPDCVITLSRTTNTIGYFSANRFTDNSKKLRKHELCLNPNYFGVLPFEKEMSTLVHEMCHMFQELKGENKSVGYHDKKWAMLMLSLGLVPTDTGKPGGKMTGYNITQIIENNGIFFNCTQRLISTGYKLTWADSHFNPENPLVITVKKKEGKGGRRFKYSCGCSNVWGKGGLSIVCNKCGMQMVPEEEQVLGEGNK